MPEGSVGNATLPLFAAPDLILSARQYTVFGSGGFRGNPTTVHQVAAFPADAELLAHSQSLVTIDNAYYLQTAQAGHYYAKCCSHTALLRVCGHALLAAGQHLLAVTGLREVTLDTPAFSHQCKRVGATGALLSVPRHSPQQITDSALVDKVLGATGLARSQLEKMLLFPFGVYVVITTSLTDLQDFQPAGCAWQDLDDLAPGALILTTALADGAYAFRYFSPWWGKPEDSATGSAHSYLAPYWLQNGVRADTLQWSPEGPASAQVLLAPDRVWIGGQVNAVDSGPSDPA